MKKITLKLAVALIAFVVGVFGTAFWFFDSFSSRNLKTEPEQIIRIVVKGQVVDPAGRPIAGAKVQSGLGLDLEGAMIETDSEGRFTAEADSRHWFKVCRPSVRAQAAGYAEEWVFFDCQGWDKGERRFEQTLVLKPKVVNTDLDKNRRLWQEKRIGDYDLTAGLYKGGSSVWAEPVLIKVRNGKAISIDILDEKYKVLSDKEAIGGYKELDTIEKMFDYIQKGLDGEADIQVKYDKNFGYPKDMRINYIKRGWDSWQTMIIEKFEIVTKE
jgi:hypothetical protein